MLYMHMLFLFYDCANAGGQRELTLGVYIIFLFSCELEF